MYMKSASRFFVSLVLTFAFLTNALPCGPSYVSPMFAVRSAPEHPYKDYAAGRIGIVKPTFHRSVLFAAYRWINGSGFSADEQKAIVEVWNAELNIRDFTDTDVTEAVKAWVEKRKDVVEKEEKTPSIYVERDYGGYDFFPNCTKNAFETAAETLSSRIASHGSDNKEVKNWLEAQDAVFSNCSSGNQKPAALQPGAPEWLQKDRAYQLAAASFYSLDYEDAKKRFAEIAQDADSPWQQTADYLVARTLIRQASLSKDAEKTKEYYEEAERHLNKFSSSSGKFSESAERLLGLIKYRLRPEERVRELAQKLSASHTSNFRQDVIDYTWLMDKFETNALKKDEEKKAAEVRKICDELDKNGNSNAYPSGGCSRIYSRSVANEPDSETTYLTSVTNTVANTANSMANAYATPLPYAANVAANAMTSAANFSTTANSNTTAYSQSSSYEGGYYGDEQISLSLLPEFLRYEDLTDWLFTYQISNTEAYLHALNRYKQTQSEVWLMAALLKANKSSTELNRLLEAASRTSRSSQAYPTVAYHAGRIYIELGKNAEAKKTIDEALDRASEMPVSSVNEFIKLRQNVTETLDDFLRYSLRKPFAFDYGGSVGTIEEFIAESKSWFNPEYNKEGKEAYEADVEKQFANELLWQNRLMIGSETIDVMNQFFPSSVLADVEKSNVLPEYLRERFAVAVWTRAALLNDAATTNRMAPKLVQHHPELADEIKAVTTAAGPIARQNAILSMIVRNPILTPFLEDGLGKTDNEVNQWDTNDYWCEPYDEVYDDDLGDMISRNQLQKPKFLTAAQVAAATSERTRLKKIGDAPKYLGQQVLQWAKRSPNDKRIPEALYLMFHANGWTKYGCGSNSELQEQIGELLKTRYANSEWAKKLISEQQDEN